MRRREQPIWTVGAGAWAAPHCLPGPPMLFTSASRRCPTPPHFAPLQANKNVMVKGQVSLQGASVATVFKSWWQPSFTLGAAASVDWATGRTRYGLTAAVETFKNIRCGARVAVAEVVAVPPAHSYCPTTGQPTRPAATPPCHTLFLYRVAGMSGRHLHRS